LVNENGKFKKKIFNKIDKIIFHSSTDLGFFSKKNMSLINKNIILTDDILLEIKKTLMKNLLSLIMEGIRNFLYYFW
jgi:hypothetical protein